MDFSVPLKLTSPRVWRTYIGGSQIDEIHGIENTKDNHFPEEWIMSIVEARNAGREESVGEGLCYIDGTSVTLRSLVNQYPQEILGSTHYENNGSTTGVLVKVIDAAERLTIQVHPNKKAASELFDSEFGKTECWQILGGREINGQKPLIYFGFKPGISREYWKKVFDKQDIQAMLHCLHRIEVKPGETYLIEAGVPHAIGAGCLLIEIQEPTDFSIRTERTTPEGYKISDYLCHQGIGFDKMFDCFEYNGMTIDNVIDKWRIPAKPLEINSEYSLHELIGYMDTNCFKLECFKINGKCKIQTNDVFFGLYVFSGRGSIKSKHKEERISPGNQFFVSAMTKEFTIEKKLDDPLIIFRCFGPKNSLKE